ncbi:MAG: VCBS repeat-containing protein [Acidobacteria bacterium]|nr:VCBS repeat-containing protein [Acidobacteriota bacterium]
MKFPIACTLLAVGAWCQPVSFLAPVRVFGRGTVGPLRNAGLAAGDFNGDGKLDLVDIPANRSGFTAPLISFGNGDGTFRDAPATSLLAEALEQAVAGDFNGDGRLDVASLSSGTRVAVFFGNGDGTLRPPVFTPLEEVISTRMIAVELNGDGLTDLVAGRFALLAKGDGTFTVRQAFGGAGSAVADFNRDGRPDIAAVSGGDVIVTLSNGDGTFRTLPAFAAPFAPKFALAADFTGDGIPDLVLGGDSGVAVLAAKGEGTFLSAVVTPGVVGDLSAVADFNGDGRMDLLARNTVLPGRGDGSFGIPSTFGVTGSVCLSSTDQRLLCGPEYMAFLAADFNGDRRPDVAAAARFTSGTVGIGYAVPVLVNNGAGDGLVIAGVSAATGRGPVTVGSLVSAFGVNLATDIAGAVSGPWPTTLGGVRVHVTYRSAISNSVVADVLAPIGFVAPGQINYLLPGEVTGVADGSTAFVTVERVGSPYVPTASVVALAASAPGLFTHGTQAIAAANAVRILADGSQQAVAVTRCTQIICLGVPINVRQGPVYLSLYGTGFSRTGSTVCTAGGLAAEVSYAGPQGGLAGLDQVNVLLPAGLAGRGLVTVECVSGGVKANGVVVLVE